MVFKRQLHRNWSNSFFSERWFVVRLLLNRLHRWFESALCSQRASLKKKCASAHFFLEKSRPSLSFYFLFNANFLGSSKSSSAFLKPIEALITDSLRSWGIQCVFDSRLFNAKPLLAGSLGMTGHLKKTRIVWIGQR